MKRWLLGRHCVRVARTVFLTGDTLVARLLLAWGSGLYAVLLVWPHLSWAARHVLLLVAPDAAGWGITDVQHPDLFARPAYALMAIVPGGTFTWAGLFMLHMVGVHWRAIELKAREGWMVAINCLGLALWTYCTLSLMLSLGSLLPSSALEVVMILFSFWITARTAVYPEIVTA